ncbi:MAG TPA: YqaJ viral recombinase family protein [Acidimicrobiia bacterium]
MNILSLQQGTPEWAAARAKHFTASEASAMMGCHPTVKRGELLRMKSTGDVKQYGQWVEEVLFARGHEVEALARPIAETIIGEELYPCTATDDAGELLASFDGLTMDETICCEIKQHNSEKVAQVAESGTVPECDYWQCVQQIAVAEAEKCLYVVSDGTEEGTVYCWLDRDPDAEAKLRAGWAQFQRDLDAYVAPDPEKPAAVGKTPDNLPALQIQVTGMVTHSNLNAFREHALSVIDGINTDLQTDEDFATAEATVKWLKKDVEERLAAAKDQALQQTADIYDVLQTLDQVAEQARTQRLHLDKLVKDRKEAVRGEIAAKARADWLDTVAQINSGLGGKVQLPEIRIDIGGAMKGKRTVSSLRDAAETEVARAKIEAHQIADRMRANLEILRTEAEGYEHLFRDAQELVQKQPDDLRAQIELRIGEHKRAEQERLEAERAKIREEEQRKAREEADAKARAEAVERERQERAAADAKRAEEQAEAQSSLQADAKPEADTQPSAKELREIAARMKERAQYADRNEYRQKEIAAAQRLEQRAAEIEKAEAPEKPKHLMSALGEWQAAHEIGPEAMSDLIGILRDYTTALDMAA